MDAKIVNIKQWKQKNHDENTSKIYLTNTRAQSLAELYYIKNGICEKALFLDFRRGELEETSALIGVNTSEMMPIDILGAYSLIKEVLDIKLAHQRELAPKEKALYDQATHILLYHTDEIKRLNIRSHDVNETLDMLANVLKYDDYGLLYELAGEKICAPSTNKHVFIHGCRESGKNSVMLPETLKITDFRTLINELGEEVTALCASWQRQDAEGGQYGFVIYLELIKLADGYALNRYLLLDHYAMHIAEDYEFKYYLASYQLPDGSWLAGALMNDKNILLSGERNYYQLYIFVRDKANACAKMLLMKNKMLLYADSKQKLKDLTAYLAKYLICDMPDLLEKEYTIDAIEMAQILLNNN